jgi:hypothetical protein
MRRYLNSVDRYWLSTEGRAMSVPWISGTDSNCAHTRAADVAPSENAKVR